MKKVWMFAVMLMVALVVTACGSDSSSSTSLMGGQIQGKALSLANVVSTIAGSTSMDGIGTDTSLFNPNGIIKSGNNLFIADADNHTIRIIDLLSGTVDTLAGKAGVTGSADGIGAEARFNWPAGITTDGTNLFVSDRLNNNIRQIVIKTRVVSTIAGTAGESGFTDGKGTAARFSAPKALTTDTAGTKLFVSDSGNHTIRQIVILTGEVTTLAGTAGESGFADGPVTSAHFNDPYGIASNGADLFVADAGNHTIRKITLSTGVVSTIAGKAETPGFADDAANGATARFNRPYGITSYGGNLFVSDYFNDTIRKVVISTGAVTTVAGMADRSGTTDGTTVTAAFNAPYDVTTTDGDNLYVSDSSNHVIRKIVISTGTVTTIAGGRIADGIGANAGFGMPAGITTDGVNLYVADCSSNTIRKIVISTGAVTTIAGTAGVSGSADGTGAAARFNWPNGITTDGTRLFVTDVDNNTVRQIVISTGAVTTIAGTAGVSGFADGTGTVAQFNSPYGITTNGVNLFVTDSGNNSIRQIVISTGVVTTIAGTAGVAGSVDGTGAVAKFNLPYGITTDGVNLFVTDLNTIRQIVISSGVVTTIAGKVGETVSVDGTGIAASFNHLHGITTDGSSLFVADQNSIRRFVISTGVVTTIAGTAGVRGFVNGSGSAAKFNTPDGITTDGTNLFVTDFFSRIIRRIQ